MFRFSNVDNVPHLTILMCLKCQIAENVTEEQNKKNDPANESVDWIGESIGWMA